MSQTPTNLVTVEKTGKNSWVMYQYGSLKQQNLQSQPLSIYRKGIYQNDLQAALQLIQPCLTVNLKFKNQQLPSPQFQMSQLLTNMPRIPEEVGFNAVEGIDQLVRRGEAGFLLPSSYIELGKQKVWPRLKECFLTQDLD